MRLGKVQGVRSNWKKRPTSREENMGYGAEGGVVVGAAPGAALAVSQFHLLLDVLVVAFHTLAQLGSAHQCSL